MTVVAIIAILLTIALPGYQESLRKGRRADAKAGLLDVANRQERLLLDRSTYALDMEDLGYDDDPMISQDQYYSIDADACAGGNIASCYVLTATPRSGFAQAGDDSCTSFVLESTPSTCSWPPRW